MQLLVTLLGKAILLGLSILGRKGTALPGLVIERLYPRYLNSMLDKLPRGVVVITGTNGKTTTTKVVTELLRASGLRVLTNPSGSNFMRGIIASLAKNATLTARLPYDIAVFEQDEAHAVHFVSRYRPVGVVALNVMRDQMDRFGEIDATAQLIGKVVTCAKDWVVLNANDKRIAALAGQQTGQKTYWFGYGKQVQSSFIDDDQLYSANPTFFEAAAPDVQLVGTSPGQVELLFQRWHKRFSAPISLEGSHNAINVTAGLTSMLAIIDQQFEPNQAMQLLSAVRPAFGRGEKVFLPNGLELQLQLVKNPAGFRHVLHSVKQTEFDAIGIAINDEYADGRDVSWLWDVDFIDLQSQRAVIMTGGTRAADMAVRLKYDEVPCAVIEPSLSRFIEHVRSRADSKAVIFCTYTAMLGLRKLLKRHDNQLRKDGL